MSDSVAFPDVMVDLESTGTDFAKNAIIQIAAVKFNLAARTISHEFFDRALLIPRNRYWDEGTREWWSKMPDVLQKIWNRMEPHGQVLSDFSGYVGSNSAMWAKPTSFDHAFLSSYYIDINSQNPFHFRKANDLNSFIRARYFPETPPNWEKDLEFVGEAHNGLHDCLHQVKVLFAVMDNTTVGTIQRATA